MYVRDLHEYSRLMLCCASPEKCGFGLPGKGYFFQFFKFCVWVRSDSLAIILLTKINVKGQIDI